MFSSSEYRNATDGPDGGKTLWIKSLFRDYKTLAKIQMLEEFPTLADDVNLKAEERIELLIGN